MRRASASTSSAAAAGSTCCARKARTATPRRAACERRSAPAPGCSYRKKPSCTSRPRRSERGRRECWCIAFAETAVSIRAALFAEFLRTALPQTVVHARRVDPGATHRRHGSISEPDRRGTRRRRQTNNFRIAVVLGNFDLLLGGHADVAFHSRNHGRKNLRQTVTGAAALSVDAPDDCGFATRSGGGILRLDLDRPQVGR